MKSPDYMESDEAEAPAEAAAETSAEESQESDNESSALINKTIWPDAKPGDKKTIECLHVYEDELSVKTVDEAPEPDAQDELEPAASGNDYME